VTAKDILKNYRSYRDIANFYKNKIIAGERLGLTVPAPVRESYERYAEKVSRIESAISGVEDPTEQLLLRLRYIEGWTWTKVNFAIHYSRSQSKRIHANALEHVVLSDTLIE
jgi:hypothetical protein